MAWAGWASDITDSRTSIDLDPCLHTESEKVTQQPDRMMLLRSCGHYGTANAGKLFPTPEPCSPVSGLLPTLELLLLLCHFFRCWEPHRVKLSEISRWLRYREKAGHFGTGAWPSPQIDKSGTGPHLPQVPQEFGSPDLVSKKLGDGGVSGFQRTEAFEMESMRLITTCACTRRPSEQSSLPRASPILCTVHKTCLSNTLVMTSHHRWMQCNSSRSCTMYTCLTALTDVVLSTAP